MADQSRKTAIFLISFRYPKSDDFFGVRANTTMTLGRLRCRVRDVATTTLSRGGGFFFFLFDIISIIVLNSYIIKLNGYRFNTPGVVVKRDTRRRIINNSGISFSTLF